MNGSHREFEILVIKAQIGTLSDEDRLRLNDLIKSPDNQKIYFEMIKINCALLQMESSGYQGQEAATLKSSFDMDLWRQLANEEKDAHVVEIPVPEEPKILIEKVQRQSVNRKISKSSWLSLAAVAAAIILILVFVRLAPKAGIEVATLADSMNAKWADTYASMSKGARFKTNSNKYFLREGLAQLIFDSEARITLEGPVEFQILTEDQIKLNYGRLYATVPQGAIGFTINTPSSRIIDLGTEFGIETAASGDTYLHVIKGRTMLIAGQKSNKVSMEVGRGYAKKVSAATAEISNIPCDTSLFVRTFNSASNIAWKGQKSFNLADVVGNGNGFGTGTFNIGIDPITGQSGTIGESDRTTSNEYKILTHNPCIDGVFVPNGKTRQIVSSQGHVFEECPGTYGNFYLDIGNTPKIAALQPSVQEELNSEAGNTCLLLHANIGITFNLDAIRSGLPGIKIKQFKSRLCISTAAPAMPNADFWVLVDGKVRYSRKNVTDKSFVDSVTIELHENDRFLSLVTTDGGDPENRIRSDGGSIKSIDCDWGMFTGPVLVLE